MPGPGTAATISAAMRNSEKSADAGTNATAPGRTRRPAPARSSSPRPETAPAHQPPSRRNAGHGSTCLPARDAWSSADGMVEIAVADFAALERPHPERALTVIAATERQHHRQRDLALAEIV